MTIIKKTDINTAFSQPLIKAKAIEKIYKMGKEDVHALKGVNIEITKGEFIGIMGPSGSGKSTLINILGCLDKPSAGIIYFEGRDIYSLSDTLRSRIRASKIGFVFQTFNLISQCTVLQNVLLPFLYTHQQDRSVEIDKAEKALELVGLLHRKNHPPSKLSGGEMQRAAIARAIVTEPLLLLADEPTGNLDTNTGKSILALFDEINQRRITLVVVTHDESVAARCSRVIKIDDGMIISDRLQK